MPFSFHGFVLMESGDSALTRRDVALVFAATCTTSTGAGSVHSGRCRTRSRRAGAIRESTSGPIAIENPLQRSRTRGEPAVPHGLTCTRNISLATVML